MQFKKCMFKLFIEKINKLINIINKAGGIWNESL